MVAVTRNAALIEPSPEAQRRADALAEVPLVLARAIRLAAAPERVFAFITDFERLPEWMPMMRRAWVDNRHAQTPGGVGAVRMIDSGFGKPTEERVVALEPPSLLAYSASDASLRGLFRSHLGVLVLEQHPAEGALRPGEGTRLSWFSYALPGRGLQRFAGPSVFKLVVDQSLARLGERFLAAP
jgi:uncharacterized protein YndB with AHSA1/START domain